MVKVFVICLASFMILTVLYYYMGLFAKDIDGGTQMARISVEVEAPSTPSEDTSPQPPSGADEGNSKEPPPDSKEEPPKSKPPGEREGDKAEKMKKDKDSR
mmetsp:Transcript_2293/g.4364  ORF Transcript_2293/g.4364 Transcript_2293/m.4364 type:complete len:101 (+) Transcript_2293:274-576(+)